MSSSAISSTSSSSSTYEPIIGIDLGTTYSCVACWNDKTNKVEVIPSPSGRTMPSWVAFTPQGKMVGSSAKSQSSSNSKNTIYDVKRIIGRSYHDEIVQDEIKSFPYEVYQDDNQTGQLKIHVNWCKQTKYLSPEEISAMILSELKMAAEKYLGKNVTKAVITVPAHFNNQQRQATKDAGLIAGLNVKRIINEPTAAALAYGLHGTKTKATGKNDDDNNNDVDDDDDSDGVRSNVVIFDLGGGTFDVSVLIMNGGVFEVRATGGDTHLGGEDFDNTILNWCLEECILNNKQNGSGGGGRDIYNQIQKNNRALSRLRRACELAKRSLSTSTSVEIEVDSLLQNYDFHVTLTRTKMEELNSLLFQRCIDTVKSVLLDAEVKIEDVTDVVLVGGSTRVPYLQQSLYNLFHQRIELCKSVHPDEAVAIGAAVQGHILTTGGTGGGKDLEAEEACTDLLLLDVTPLSLGIELEGRVMSTLIKRNTAIPCQKTRTYTTVSDYQTEIDVVVYEGERTIVDSNHKLGSFVISGVQRAKAGEPKVNVTFALDANGILNVSAYDQVTNASANATIRAERGRLNSEDIERMIADAERYREQDLELANKMAYKTALEEALYTVQSSTTATHDDNELAEMMDWLELDSDSATLEEMKNRGRLLEDKYGVIVKTH